MVPLCPQGPVVLIVDHMEFRRARVVHFLIDWAEQEGVSLSSLRFEQAHRALRDRPNEFRMVILSVGAASCAGSDVLSEIKLIHTLAPAAFLAVVTDEENPEDVIAAMQAGAAAYISERSDPDMVLRVLSFVLHGGTYFPRSVVDRSSFPSDSTITATTEARGATSDPSVTEPAHRTFRDIPGLDNLAGLSDRQRAILDGLCHGEPNKIIGRRLDLPESTVKVHVREIMRKLAVSNRTQVALAVSRFSAAIDIGANSSASREPPLLDQAPSHPRFPLRPDAISRAPCRLQTETKKSESSEEIRQPSHPTGGPNGSRGSEV